MQAQTGTHTDGEAHVRMGMLKHTHHLMRHLRYPTCLSSGWYEVELTAS